MKVEITSTQSQELKRVLDGLANAQPVLEVAAQDVANALRDHFAARNLRPNKKGWPKRNIWNQIRAATGVASISPIQAVVGVASPILAHMITGGTIEAKRGKYLTIPQTAQAYAAGSPREGATPELAPIVRRIKGRLRAIGLGTDIRTAKSGRKYAVGGMWYRLVEAVTQEADPDAMPSTEYLGQVVLRSIGEFMASPYGKSTQA